MKNVFVTGSGRSGTSMLAGMFARAGYFLGDRLYPPREANPKGFFEDEHINRLNEEIITCSVRTTFGSPAATGLLGRYKTGHLWLARFPIEHDFVCNDEQRGAIRGLTARQPFCFKDPRFCFTLENWTARVPDSLVLCIFREPASTVESILKECRSAPYLFDFSISVQDAFAIWREIYWRMLRLYERYSNIRFVCYDDVINGSVLERLDDIVETELDRTFPEAGLNRTTSTLVVDALSRMVFDVLVNLGKDDLGESRDVSRLSLIREVDERLSLAGPERSARERGGIGGGELFVSGARRGPDRKGPGAQVELGQEDREPQEGKDARVQVLATTVLALREALSQNREQLSNLQRTTASQEASIETLRVEIGECNIEILELRRKGGERDAEIAALRGEIAKDEAEIAALRGELAKDEAEIAALRAALAKGEAEIAALHASTSWRITKPIRRLARLRAAATSMAARLWRRKQ